MTVVVKMRKPSGRIIFFPQNVLRVHSFSGEAVALPTFLLQALASRRVPRHAVLLPRPFGTLVVMAREIPLPVPSLVPQGQKVLPAVVRATFIPPLAVTHS